MLPLLALLACRPAAEPSDTAALELPGYDIASELCFSEVARYEGEEALVYDVGWSPDGALLATGSLNLLRLFRFGGEALTLLDTVRNIDRFNSIQWLPDGEHLLAPTGSRLRMFSVDGDRLREVARGPWHPEDLQRVALSGDGRRALSCDEVGAVYLYDVDVGAASVTLRASLPVHERCTRVAWSPGGTMALSAGHDGTIALTEVGTESLVVLDRLEAEEETGEAIFGRDDTEAVGGSFGSLNTMWYLGVDVDSGSLSVRQTVEGHLSGIGALEWRHDGEVLLSGAHDHSVTAWERGGGGLRAVGALAHDGAGTHSARWSPDDRHVARTGSNRDLLQVLAVGPCGP